MAKTHTTTIDLYGMSGTGNTKAEAKADAVRKLEAATEGIYTPMLLRFPGDYIGLVYRTLDGWEYTYLSPHQEWVHGFCMSGYATAKDAERYLRAHIAQNLIGVTPDNGLSIITNEGDRLRHQEDIAWHERYVAYKAQGYTNQECQRMACESRAFCPTV